MNGIIDVGGGMRGVYTAGVYDYLLDHQIRFDYCIGVSAGSANMMSYLAGQRGRNKRFYVDYAGRPGLYELEQLSPKRLLSGPGLHLFRAEQFGWGNDRWTMRRFWPLPPNMWWWRPTA